MPCWRFQALYKIREPFTIYPYGSYGCQGVNSCSVSTGVMLTYQTTCQLLMTNDSPAVVFLPPRHSSWVVHWLVPQQSLAHVMCPYQQQQWRNWWSSVHMAQISTINTCKNGARQAIQWEQRTTTGSQDGHCQMRSEGYGHYLGWSRRTGNKQSRMEPMCGPMKPSRCEMN